jgi:hypothetical protein
MLVLRPVGGLCNRMLAIASAIQLSKDSNQSLKIIWERNAMLNACFSDLFKPLVPGIPLVETQSNQTLIERAWKRLLHLGYSKVIYLTTLTTNQISASSISNHQKILIYGANRFYELGNLSELFIPQDDLSREIAAQKKRLGASAIGLHIRRTDHSHSISKSPTSLFADRIDAEIKINPEALFFLATDDPEEETFLLRKYPNKIITHPKKTLDRNEKEGIKDALVDLLCLAHCVKIYGSYYSSFSFTAARFSGRELVVIGEEGL